MKKLVVLFVIIPLLSFQSVETEISIIGKWKGEDKGDIGYVSFDEEGYALFESNGQKMGGKEFFMKGQKAKLTYKLNRKVTPIELDLIITILESGESQSLLGILEFETNDKMHLAIGFDGSARPTEFTDSNSIYFFRE
ncbi:hypothetical protein [Psychroserpens sp. SPM9]|uniref:hypothetical protein n=1 Tax=Psychroserpens sp. SPM9 TaxID=2975598 RepID=UPI0021A309D0|nr:hypothetical protein [Psychroserpens sp. SPM9]MDG5492703.1 hypothetical protein [Psychroserpens sp. SPM9]